MDKYGKLEEDAPPQYSEVSGGPPQYPNASQYPPQYPSAAAPVVAPGAPVYPAPPGGYVIQGGQQPVVGQPQIVYVQAPMISEQEAPDHLVMAILVTICCCLPLGIVGILKASECRNARMRGDRENALLYGREAKKFSMIGLGCGIAIIVIILAIYGVAIALALSNANQMH